MADIKPFKCVRPTPELAHRTAALPYDVYNRAEARVAAAKDELSFLNIDRPETGLPEDADMYGDEAYARAKNLLEKEIADGVYIEDGDESYYVYELIMDGRSQKGIVACASIDDYVNGVIKKHENTRADKEKDRIRHVDTCSAQTGPIFLAYRSNQVLADVIATVMSTPMLTGFTSDDGITHNVWKIADAALIDTVRETFSAMDDIYIADGHHRAASAVKVGLKRRKENPGYTGAEEFNYFLSVLFDEDELMILPYNRVVADLCGDSAEEFIRRVGASFIVEEVGEEAYAPEEKGVFGMYLEGKWYKLEPREDIPEDDPVASLDVSVLQDRLLGRVLNIKDPRTDKRIDFIGGIRGLGELERRCKTDMKVAFSMYPTSISELFDVADAGLLMPPKSTWFEPKLRSGLFIHRI